PNTLYTFDYSLSLLAGTIDGFNCEACSYDLSIFITDPNGKLIELPVVLGNQSPSNLRYVRRNISCTTPPEAAIMFDVVLSDIGDYTITKKVVPHDPTIDEMNTIVRQNVSVQTRIDEITNSYIIDPSECAICTGGCPE